MKTIYLATGNHPIYENLSTHPPEGYKYVGYTPQAQFEKLSVYSKKSRLRKTIMDRITKVIGLPRMYYYRQNVDLIHSSRGVLVLNRKPWVIDIEHAASFTGMHYDNLFKAKRIVARMLDSKYCKAILPHCNAAERSMTAFFGNRWQEKTKTIYPAVEWESVNRNKRDEFTILFIGNVFDKKGGMEVLKAFSSLEKKYDIKLIMKSPVPEDVKSKFDSENIQYINTHLTREEIKNLYRSSDTFVMPTHMDTFGYVFLEAMGFGLPLIGTDIFAVPEIIEDENNGFLINTKYDWALKNGLPDPKFTYEKALSKENSDHVTNQIKEKLSVIIEDTKLKNNLSKNSLEMAKTGKFSITKRNKDLKEVYESSLRR